ncbi:MAG: rod shape-determining protein RodA [bacterium]|nr:rod shape-determining protein RodA [bacterium]
MRRYNLSMEHRIDPWILVAILSIIGMSLLTLHAAEEVVGGQLLLRQTVWGALGLTGFWILSRVHITVYERWAPVLYVAGLAILLSVLFFGEVRSGTRGWFAIGPLTIQPSEFARLTTLLVAAVWVARRENLYLTAREVVAILALVAAPVALVLFQPDLGVALTYLPVLAGALWLGGLRAKAWLAVAMLGIALVVGAWHTVLQPYQKDRVLTILDPERDPYGAGYQVRQSKIAVGSGGAWGQGLGQGSQSVLRFLPAQHTDFIFAAWAESTGFLGTAALLTAYALLLGRIGLVAAKTPGRHGLVLAVLVGLWLAFQVIVSVGMAVGWMPTTGITLPLFSYGGSSLLTTCLALGVVQSVWRHRLVNL